MLSISIHAAGVSEFRASRSNRFRNLESSCMCSELQRAIPHLSTSVILPGDHSPTSKRCDHAPAKALKPSSWSSWKQNGIWTSQSGSDLNVHVRRNVGTTRTTLGAFDPILADHFGSIHTRCNACPDVLALWQPACDGTRVFISDGQGQTCLGNVGANHIHWFIQLFLKLLAFDILWLVSMRWPKSGLQSNRALGFHGFPQGQLKLQPSRLGRSTIHHVYFHFVKHERWEQHRVIMRMQNDVKIWKTKAPKSSTQIPDPKRPEFRWQKVSRPHGNCSALIQTGKLKLLWGQCSMLRKKSRTGMDTPGDSKTPQTESVLWCPPSMRSNKAESHFIMFDWHLPGYAFTRTRKICFNRTSAFHVLILGQHLLCVYSLSHPA